MNAEERKKYNREYYRKNKRRIRAQQKMFYKEHPERRRIVYLNYYEKNKEKIKQWQKGYQKVYQPLYYRRKKKERENG